MSEWHGYSAKLACLTSIEKAILLGMVYSQVMKNKAEGKSQYYHNDQFWMTAASTDLEKLYPYMNERSIRKWMGEMEKDGWIISGKFNTKRYDKTKWYTCGERLLNFVDNYGLFFDGDAARIGVSDRGRLLEIETKYHAIRNTVLELIKGTDNE